MRSFGTLLFATFAIVLGSAASLPPAHAQDLESGEGEPAPASTAPSASTVTPPSEVAVVLRNSSRDAASIEHRLVTSDGTSVGSCRGSCTLLVPPGSYVLETSETEALRAGRKPIVVNGPTIVDVRPGSKSIRTTGLVLGTTGTLLLVVGVVGFLNAGFVRGNTDYVDCPSCPKPSYAPWVVSTLVGASATTAGWILFWSASTKMKVSEYAPSIAFAPLVTSSVAGAALAVRF